MLPVIIAIISEIKGLHVPFAEHLVLIVNIVRRKKNAVRKIFIRRIYFVSDGKSLEKE